MSIEPETVIFGTERLIARRLVMEDAEAMQAIYGDPEAMTYVGDAQPLTIDNCRYWVDVTDRNFEMRGYGMIALVERETGDLIACAGVVHPNQQEEPEVKYAIRRDKWGLGFATEIVSALVDHAHAVLGKNHLSATVNPGHVRSQSVLRKTGFHHAEDRKNEDSTVTEVWRIDLPRRRAP